MTDVDSDTGTLLALVQNWDTHTRPRLEKIKASVDAGGQLTAVELAFLEQIGPRAGRIEPLLKRNPEYRRLFALAVSLYREITERALENERNAPAR